MPNAELLKFIKNRLREGATEQEIRNELAAEGWRDRNISAVLARAAKAFAIKKRLFGKTGLGVAAVIVVLLAAVGGGYFARRQMQKNSEANSQALPIFASTHQPPQEQNFPTPAATYLAYKQQLETQTKTGQDIFNLFRKYRPQAIINAWDEEGVNQVFAGPDGTPNDPRVVQAMLNALTKTAPPLSAIYVAQITVEKVDTASVILHAVASAKYKGGISIVLEPGGWKIQSENWPDWPVGGPGAATAK